MLTKEQISSLKPGDVVYVDFPDYEETKRNYYNITGKYYPRTVTLWMYNNLKGIYHGKSVKIVDIDIDHENDSKGCSIMDNNGDTFSSLVLSLTDPKTKYETTKDDHEGMIWNEHTKTWSWF